MIGMKIDRSPEKRVADIYEREIVGRKEIQSVSVSIQSAWHSSRLPRRTRGLLLLTSSFFPLSVLSQKLFFFNGKN